MTSTTVIIQDAFRESNIIGVDDVPTTDQQTEAMRRLSSLVAAVYGYDVGEELADWMVGYQGQMYPNYGWTELKWRWPLENSRILLNMNTEQTLYFPLRPNDGARMQIIDVQGVLATYPVTISANGRLIEGAPTLLLNTDDLNQTWIFNAEQANWVPQEVTLIDEEMPFPSAFDDYFIIKLAARINPRYGRSLDELSIARLQEQQEKLEAKYRQSRQMPAQQGVRRLSDPNQRYFYGGNWRGQFGWMQ